MQQVQQQSEGEYDVRLCVEEAGLVVGRQTAPVTTCSVIFTSPILRDHLLTPSPGMCHCITAFVCLDGLHHHWRIFFPKSVFAYFMSYCGIFRIGLSIKIRAVRLTR